jgi:hypothetical protein
MREPIRPRHYIHSAISTKASTQNCLGLRLKWISMAMTIIYYHICGWYEKVAGKLLGNDLLEVFHQLYTYLLRYVYLFLYLL